MGMILVPFWAIFTEAYAKKDSQDLKKIMNKLLRLASLLALACIVMALLSGFVYNIWIGNLIRIPSDINLATCFYSMLLILGSVYATCVNGTGKIKLHMLISVFSAIFHIPLSILLITYYNIGVPGLLFLSSFWIIIGIFLRHLQYLNLVQFKEKENFWYR
jgi:O-antigen/teichoic acid export membrane protein